MSSGKPIRQNLLRYLDSKVGQRLYVSDVATDLNETETRILHGLNNLLQDGYRMTRVSTGVYDVAPDAHQSKLAHRARRPKATTSPGKRMFEEVGTAKDGTVILQCEDGRLFKATEI